MPRFGHLAMKRRDEAATPAGAHDEPVSHELGVRLLHGTEAVGDGLCQLGLGRQPHAGVQSPGGNGLDDGVAEHPVFRPWRRLGGGHADCSIIGIALDHRRIISP